MLLNGRPGEKGFPSKGLRQGDLISPYLFILCVEDLSSMLNFASQRGDIRGVSVAREGLRVKHMLFSDDCVLFGRQEGKNEGS